MNEGWGVGGLDGSRFVPPPLFARAPPAPASHDSLFALPQHPSIRGSTPSTCSPPRRKTRAGAGPGPEAVAGRASAATRRPPRTPRTPSFRCPRGSTPARPLHHQHHLRAARGDAPTAGPPWHALSPGTDLNKPPATSRVSSDAASVEPWQPYRLFPTHQPPRGGPAPPDFVSTADNLKTLLQLPWTNRPVRLAVHRLGNTLLLDDVIVDPTSSTHDSFRAPRADTNGGELPPRSRPAPPGFPGSPRGARPVSIPPLPPRAAPRDYAAALATAAATSDADAPAPPPPVITGEAHAILEAKLLYHSLSAETRFDLPRLDDAANARRDETHDASSAFQRLALPPPATPRDVRAMVPWAPGDVRRSRPDANADETADANGDARRLTADGGAASDRRSPPASVASLGALQLRGPAKAVARAAAAAAGAGVTLARNPYETPEEDEDAEDVAEDDAGDDAASDADSDGNARRSGSGARSVRAAGGRSRRGRSAANAPRDGDWSSSSSSSSGPRAPPEFGQPHLFEWEVGHRLLVESSLVVFRGEGRTPMSLKLVDLAAERPNTGAALSTWLDNTIAGVPELAVCYHRDGLIHHYDVLRTDDVARLCAPPFDPDAILAYAERVLAFLRVHCSDDGSQYWLLGDGTPEGGLHLYDVTKGVTVGGGGGGRGDDVSGDDVSGDDAASAASRTRPDATPALPAPAPIRLPWTDRSSSAVGTGATTPSEDPGSSLGVPGVAGAAGRYALLERVAAVLTADAHPEMFAAYKEELAAACLSGANVDLDERFDDRFDDEDETARAPSTTPGAAPPLASSRGDLAPGAGTRAARRALEHLTEAERALAGAAAKAHPASPRVKLEAHLRRVRGARSACKVGMARRAYRAGRLGTALAMAESAVVDAPDSAAALVATADAHAALRRAADVPDTVDAAAREWRAARRAERRREGTDDDEDDVDEAKDGKRGRTRRRTGDERGGRRRRETNGRDAAASIGPFVFAGLGPGDANRHTAAAESWYHAAATCATAASEPAGLTNAWRRYGAIRNERGKAELQAAAAALEASPGGAPGSDAGAAAAALVRAEACYEDAAAAFESARDPVNAALVGLNRAQARRARSTWNLPPTTPEDSNPPGPKPETDALQWRLEEFDAAARLCRGALASLSRLSRGGGGARAVSGPPGVVAAVRVELANALLAEGLLRCERGAHESPGSAASGAAAARMEEAIRTLQVGVAGSPAAAATLATAHYHLGVILADAALAADERGGAGSRSAAGTKAGGLGANPGVSPRAAPPRHHERALAGFPAEDAPLDPFVFGCDWRVSRPPPRAPRSRGRAPAASHRSSLSHLLAAAPAFEATTGHPRRREKSRRGVVRGAKRRRHRAGGRVGGARAIVQGWQTTRRAPRTLLGGVAFPRGKKGGARKRRGRRRNRRRGRDRGRETRWGRRRDGE